MIEAVSCHVGRHGTTRTPLPRRLDERHATVSKEAYGAFVGIAHIGWIRSHFEHSPMSARVSRMRADNALYRAVKLAGTGELSRHDYSRTKPPIGRIRDVSRSLDA